MHRAFQTAQTRFPPAYYPITVTTIREPHAISGVALYFWTIVAEMFDTEATDRDKLVAVSCAALQKEVRIFLGGGARGAA